MGVKDIRNLAFDGGQLVRYRALVEPRIVLYGGNLGDKLLDPVPAVSVIWEAG